MIVEIVSVPNQSLIDCNNNPIKYGFTKEFLNEDGVIVKSKCVSIRNPELFDDFVVGCKVEI
tara:strand:+ start:632 stop:817 length:186 start_codon:yes stop_codon:yes gene_type:complete